MILESKAGKILRGLRGEGALDREAVVESLLRLSQLTTDFPDINGIDINPLKVLKKGVVALDARILLRKTGGK
jgi:acetyltransferase